MADVPRTPTPATKPPSVPQPQLRSAKPWVELTTAEMIDLGARYREALRPAPGAQVSKLLAKLSLHFWQPDRPQWQTELIFEDYAADLSRYPLDLIAEACVTWRRTGKFWPKISELLDLVLPKHAMRLADLQQLDELMKARGRAPKKTEEERRDAVTQLERPKKALGPAGPLHIGAVLQASYVPLPNALREATLAKVERSGPSLQRNGSLNGQARAGQEEHDEELDGNVGRAKAHARGGRVNR